tara:strand:+ start:192 stop:1094 length:903 start_codon:yes stop_codon:yes gene_type:complete
MYCFEEYPIDSNVFCLFIGLGLYGLIWNTYNNGDNAGGTNHEGTNEGGDTVNLYKIGLYSFLQTKYQRLHSFLIEPVMNVLKKEKEEEISLIKDGKCLVHITKDEYDSIKESEEPLYDFIMRCVPNDENAYDIQIVDSLKNVEDNLEESSVNFLSIVLTLKYMMDNEEVVEEFELDKLFQNNNLMMVGNEIFSNKFIQWYMFTYEDIELENSDDISISFIDHEINKIVLENGESILIQKDDYVIKKSNADNYNNVLMELKEKYSYKTDMNYDIKRKVLNELKEKHKNKEENDSIYNYWIF